MSLTREDHYSKWRSVSRRIAVAIRQGRPASAWRVLEKIVVDEPLASDRLELGFLRRAIALLVVSDEIPLAHRIIEAHERRRSQQGELPPDVASQYQILRLTAAYQSKDYAEAFRIEADVSWDVIHSVPWVFLVRVVMAHQRGDRQELLDLLRRPSARILNPPDLSDPYDRASLFRVLAEFFHYHGRPNKARAYARLAVRELKRDASVDADLARLLTEGTWGARAMLEGRFEEAEAYVQRALGGSRQLQNRVFIARFEVELARIYAEQGHAARAARLLMGTIARLRRARRGRFVDYHLASAYVLAARVLGDLGELRRALHFGNLAEAVLERCAHRRLRGQLHRTRGRILALHGDPALWSLALEELERADDCFRARGTDDPVELGLVHVCRGQLYLRCGRSDRALQEAIAALQLLGPNRSPLWSANLLHFQSQILASGQLPDGDKLYEDILSNLGLVTSPIRLFKIISNLYFYTWGRDEHLDLNVHHLRQVNRMAEVLDRETFEDLYERHVSRRVAQRMMVKTLGLQPDTVDEPA